ncbi:CIA30 family protein [Synechococcus sp. PCC 6312]|uniref:CIA30 family protein n=1 Tax=Synechococcus sp. (strain ATCC 27167 / PCC 6312) TaxID=195253 RepID=UPI00029F2C39|nr:CIA30 family protein [Synechococcus sp. PCC 6312]AFY59699.1 NmrA-like family protein [Synechococcus sp. PCC 6312]
MASPTEQDNPPSPQAWDLGRFTQTLAFFIDPRSFIETLPLVGSLSQWPAWLTPFLPPELQPISNTPQSTVLVLGATGNLGRRVVALLLAQQYRVKALVRNPARANDILGTSTLSPAQQAQLTLMVGDVTQAESLPADLLTDVDAVISCLGAIVRPANPENREAKYTEGTTYYEPALIEATPEQVEYQGIQNLLNLAQPHFQATSGQRIIFDFCPPNEANAQLWGALDDVVMGGVSQSGLRILTTSALFTGVVSTANSGGFVSIRTKNFQPPLDLSRFEGIQLRLKGDGQRYKFFIRSSPAWDGVGYAFSFDTVADQWQTLKIPFEQLTPVFRAKRNPAAPPFEPTTVYSLQLMLSKFEYDGGLNPHFQPGPFALELETISAYLDHHPLPRWIMVSSAGATRPGTPEAATDPRPIVRLSEQLGGILTWKFRGEELIRQSGIPYTIIRPTALTEATGQQPLIMSQGDTLAGKVSRQDVAQLCVQALKWPAAVQKTLEIAAGDGGIVPQDWGRGLELLKAD